ncbi:MAG: LysR family transcriptional regulator [Burkholderiales bacterium RIFOXYC12_FULL_60_6]|nr:MAG: LysR family transcriptional regulator [Burkholderiales bacterium RIFOXYC12_FULL_60_6]
MQLNLDDIALFIRIAELGSLSAAARERNVPVSQVTRSLARLEAAAKVRLLHRSTHGLSLTDEGDTFLNYGHQLLATKDELAGELTGKLSGPSGWVRVAVSPLLAQMVLAPSLNGLYQRHPQLHIDIAADDRMVDMARDGIDIAIRTGTPNSDTLVARQIGDYSRSLYAAPSYLARCGTPQHPDALARHHLIASSVNANHNRWPLKPEPGRKSAGVFEVSGQTRTDNSAVTLSLVQQGVGIGRLMDLLARPLVACGALVPLLSAYFDSPRVPIYAVMLQERHRLPKIRACIDYWAQWLAEFEQPAMSIP